MATGSQMTAVPTTGMSEANPIMLFGAFSLDLGKIESVKCEPGVFGGLFGYGKVTLTASSSQRLVVSNLRRPHVLGQEIFAAK